MQSYYRCHLCNKEITDVRFTFKEIIYGWEDGAETRGYCDDCGEKIKNLTLDQINQIRSITLTDQNIFRKD